MGGDRCGKGNQAMSSQEPKWLPGCVRFSHNAGARGKHKMGDSQANQPITFLFQVSGRMGLRRNVQLHGWGLCLFISCVCGDSPWGSTVMYCFQGASFSRLIGKCTWVFSFNKCPHKPPAYYPTTASSTHFCGTRFLNKGPLQLVSDSWSSALPIRQNANMS